MFLVLRNPQGGSPIRSWLQRMRRKDETFQLDAEGRAQIVEDFYTYRVGYCSGCSEKLYIKESTAKQLQKLLRRVF